MKTRLRGFETRDGDGLSVRWSCKGNVGLRIGVVLLLFGGAWWTSIEAGNQTFEVESPGRMIIL